MPNRSRIKGSIHTYMHTHTHIYIYIHIHTVNVFQLLLSGGSIPGLGFGFRGSGVSQISGTREFRGYVGS